MEIDIDKEVERMKKSNSKFKGKVGFIIVLLAVVLIVVGLVLVFLPDREEAKPNKTITNDSEELKKLHCLDGLCVEKMDISYNEGEGVGSILFYIQNTGEVDVPAGFLKVVFDNSNQKEFILRYVDFLPGDTQSIEIEFTEKDITETTDYELQYLTEEELQTVTSY